MFKACLRRQRLLIGVNIDLLIFLIYFKNYFKLLDNFIKNRFFRIFKILTYHK